MAGLLGGRGRISEPVRGRPALTRWAAVAHLTAAEFSAAAHPAAGSVAESCSGTGAPAWCRMAPQATLDASAGAGIGGRMLTVLDLWPHTGLKRPSCPPALRNYLWHRMALHGA